MNKVIIFSLEGIESNTEVNFFNGINKQFEIDLKIYAIGKQGKKTKDLERVKASLYKLSPYLLDIKKQFYVFFIGDGDVVDDIKPMQRCKNTIIKYLLEELEFKKGEEIILEEELIYEENKSLDDVLNGNEHIKKSGLIDYKEKKHKQKRNTDFFSKLIEVCSSKKAKNCINLEKKITEEWFKNTKYENFIKTILN